MLPRVILHNSVSLDSKTEDFMPDIETHYEVMGKFNIDLHLAGSDTIAAPQEPIQPEDEDAFKPLKEKNNDSRSILAIPDSSGKVRNWHMLKKAPFWRKHIALCTNSTPNEYIEYLEKRHIEHIINGDHKVDMKGALELMNEKYGVKNVLLDSGGTLNGILLVEGLVDDVSLLIHPLLLGGNEPKSFFRSLEPKAIKEPIELKLKEVRKMKNHMLWVHYEIVK